MIDSAYIYIYIYLFGLGGNVVTRPDTKSSQIGHNVTSQNQHSMTSEKGLKADIITSHLRSQSQNVTSQCYIYMLLRYGLYGILLYCHNL